MPKQTLFVVTDELQRVLDNLPPNEPRSRLEPFRAFILRWRREGRSYERIRKILREQCHVEVAHDTLFQFVKRRSRPRKPQAEPEAGLPVSQAAQDRPAPAPEQIPRQHTQLSPEGAATRRGLLQSFRNKPALPPRPAVLEEFHYDEDKPLTIDRTIKD